MIIGITGGKGGTGKSTVATALACKLAKKHKVLLVDADADCPNDHLLLNIEIEKISTVEQRVPRWDLDRCTKCGLCGKLCKTNAILAIKEKNPIFIEEQCNGCGACVIRCPVKAISWSKKEVGSIYTGKKHDIDLLSGELKINEPVSEIVVKGLIDIIEKRKDDYDYIILDTAAGTHCDVIAALESCNIVFAVTEPTPLGAHDLKLILKLTNKMNIIAGVIINRSDVGDKTETEELVKENGSEIVCNIPYSKDIIRSYSEGIPITDKSIDEIIKRL